MEAKHRYIYTLLLHESKFSIGTALISYI